MISLGISTCPNDTFAFAALHDGRVDAPDFGWTLADIEELNEKLLRRELDVSKASFHLALEVAEDYCVLPVGAALGFGVGPLLLAAPAGESRPEPGPKSRVLCPGRWTTAHLLYRLFYPDAAAAEHVVFSEIMPALENGEADFGVVIHEGRFTYEALGLTCVADLGELWHRATSAPLPLGGILARRALGRERIAEITRSISESLAAARRDPELAIPFMQQHAQEFEREVLDEHVRLYVNEQTTELDESGWRALDTLAERAHAAGLIDRCVSLR